MIICRGVQGSSEKIMESIFQDLKKGRYNISAQNFNVLG
jgi:hypothetical protein